MDMGATFGRAWWAAWLIAAYVVARVVSAHAGELPPAGAPAIDELFHKVAPSVVAIRARGRDAMAGGQTRFIETGSGVLISADGQVLTAAYVVHGMDEIAVEFPGGETVSARVVASEPATADLSLLQLDRVPTNSTVSPMADSNTVSVGEQILIVGAPYRLPHSRSVGSIRARWAPSTAYRSMPVAEFFQTDATIDADNSGGPMFNLRGEVIGIVSHNIAKGDRSEGRGFVVTLDTAKHLLLEKRSAGSGIAQRSCSASAPSC
jgi:serine protease Do